MADAQQGRGGRVAIGGDVGHAFVGWMGFLVKIRGKTGGRIKEIQKERRMIS